MPRVLLFVTDLEVGGTPTVVRELARRLPGNGFEVGVACLARQGPTGTAIEADGGDVTAFGTRLLQLPTAVKRLRRLVLDERYDTVLSLLVHANVVASLARQADDGVHWWQSIQTTQPRPRWHWLAQRFAARRAAGIIVPSSSVAAAAAHRSGIDMSQLHVIANGIDQRDIATTPRPVTSGPLRVVFLGRLDPVKRVPMLMAAVQDTQGVTLDIFGDGSERQQIEASTSDRIRLHGTTPRDQALASADVLVLPSEAEGFGLVLIEAMAAGVPVAGADVPGICDVIRQGQTGLLFTPATLRQTLETLRDDRVASQARAAMALADVRERFTWQALVPQYRRMLGGTTLPLRATKK